MLDFNKVFDNNTDARVELPKELVEYLSKKNLPNGLKYIANNNGYCVAVGDDSSFTISGFDIKLSDEQKKIIGTNVSFKDILDYLYNSQTKVELKLKKDGVIVMNGEEVPVSNLVVSPLNPIKIEEGKFYLIPQKFPSPFSLKVGNGKYERELLIKRIPSKTKNIICFQSEEQKPFVMNYSFKEKKNEIDMNFSFNLKYAESIRDVVESTMIYNSIADGEGYLNGSQIGRVVIKQEVKKFDEKSAIFWEKVLEIEEMLDLNFIPPNENVGYDVICEVETLYQNLVNKIPIRDKNRIDSINGDWKFKDINKMSKSIGKSLFFQFKGTYMTEIFGVKIELPAIFVIFNSTFKSFENNNKTIVLSDESENKKRYTVVQCFKTEQEVDDYLSKGIKEIENKFRDSKKAFEYIN